MSSTNMRSAYRVFAGNVPVHPASTKPAPPEDPLIPTPSGCKNLRVLTVALTTRHGSQARLADLLGLTPRWVSRMATARPQDDRAFTIPRWVVECLAKCVAKDATVEDALAGRLLARVQEGDA